MEKKSFVRLILSCKYIFVFFGRKRYHTFNFLRQNVRKESAWIWGDHYIYNLLAGILYGAMNSIVYIDRNNW